MKDETFLSLSFAATIAYGLLALAGLLAAALVLGSQSAVVFALLAVGAAYLSQSLATVSLAVAWAGAWARYLQLASGALFLFGLAAL